ncbi:hypothetical protein [Streptomyces acidiscabies]|uniref:hypothetical protein n=1 Tax=Streptomyces acidiscabies TaxID=42234 RepID=UPI00073F2FA8|nr:hypothetical protein [Streptomyces acidiscabies]GAQ56221.1 hypothetical protein a10_06073 [Streptomyces acidiscabies]
MHGERPFHEELRAAIAASGLSLDRIHERLRLRGVPVSAATLSSWQSGRHQPERRRSLSALAVLEDVLSLPPASLSARLAPPRPRGRWLPPGDGLPALDRAWPLGGARGAVDVRWDSSLTRLSCHNRAEVDGQRRLRSLSSRRLLRAEADGADRWIALYRLDSPGPLPRIRLAEPLRLGTVVELPEEGLVVAEMLFERPLARGETVIVDYTVEHREPRPVTRHVETAIHVPMREHLLEVRFDPEALPYACYSYRTTGLEGDSRGARFRREQRLRVDAAGVVHAVALGAGECRFGIRWVWG